ncbi:MAG: hypothetical protein LAP38_07215 [Acidobacteriia bacterium]|nr:hypothetical protein [Terriglobia bacterium]
MTVAGLLAAVGLTYAASLFTGKMLLQILEIKLYRSEERFIGFVLGSAVLSTLVFALTAAGLAYAGVFLGLGAAIVLLGVWRGAHRFSSEVLPPLPTAWRFGFLLLYAIFAVMYLEAAMAPETGPDALLYHVAFPARYLRLHHFPANTRNLLANLSEGVEMLFLFAYPLARESAGAMVHLLFTLAMPWGLLSWGRRAGFPMVGAAGGLLFFIAPIVGKLGTTGYIDVAVACYAFAVFYLLDIWRTAKTTGLLVAVGLLAGFCFDAKYTAAAAIPYAIGYTSFYLWRERKPPWRAAILIGLCALAMMSPYLIKNTVLIGNPVAPFANRFFPNRLLTPDLEAQYSSVMRHWQNVTWAQVPREITVGGGHLQGILGPVFVLAPLALLALRFPEGRRLLAALVAFGAAYPASIATRFLVPAVPFAALALALLLRRWRFALAGLVLVHAVLSWPTVVSRYCAPYCWRMSKVQLKFALRRVSETDFLHGAVGEYDMGRAMEAHVPAGEPIFALSGFQQLYQNHEIIVGWESAFGNRLSTAMLSARLNHLRPVKAQQFQFPEKTVRGLRLLYAGAGKPEPWGVTEFRIFRNSHELARAPAWRLTASHNRRDVQQAFDNNPVTNWTSGQAASPGMWIQVDFGADQPIDRVLVETSDYDQGPVRLMLQSGGQWQTLPKGPDEYPIPPPSGLRRAATQVLKMDHVNWLVMGQDDFIADDLARNPASWGVTLVASDQRYWLYRIN